MRRTLVCLSRIFRFDSQETGAPGLLLVVAAAVITMSVSCSKPAAPPDSSQGDTSALESAEPAPSTPIPATAKPPTPTAGTAAGPKIVCDAPVYDFGSAVNTKPIQHTFVLKNAGTAPLEIAGTSTSCGCTVATLDKKSLAPGETTELKADLSLTGKTGVLSKTITVRSNDTSTPQGLFTLTMKGTATALIKVLPLYLAWDSIPKDAEASKTLNVEATAPDVTFAITGVDIIAPKLPQVSLVAAQGSVAAPPPAAESPRLATQIETVEAGKQYRIIVKTVPPLAEGFLNAVVRIHTDHPDYPEIQVQTSGNVLGEIGVMPASIDVPSPGTKDTPISRFVRIVPGTVKKFKVLGVETPFPSISATINEQPGNIVLIELKNIVPSQELDGKAVVVATDVPGHTEIRVPFKVRVLPVIPTPLPAAPNTPPTAKPAQSALPALPPIPAPSGAK